MNPPRTPWATGVAALVAATMLAFSAGCSSTASSGSVVQDVKANKVLRVGVAPAPPYSSLNPGTGNWEGVAVDLTTEWAASLGVKPENVGTTYGVIVAGLQAGRYDVVPVLNDTPERRSAVMFSDPITTAISAATVLPDRDHIDSWEALNTASHSICTVAGSADDATLTNAKPVAKILRLADLNACKLALQSQRTDALFDEWHSQGEYASQTDGVRIVFPPNELGRQSVSAALSKSATADDLAALNAAVKTFRESGALAKSMKKWGSVNPLDFAVGPVPGYAKELADGEFRA
jgi:ABC-type amino acid transport substrate-binding protein